MELLHSACCDLLYTKYLPVEKVIHSQRLMVQTLKLVVESTDVNAEGTSCPMETTGLQVQTYTASW